MVKSVFLLNVLSSYLSKSVYFLLINVFISRTPCPFNYQFCKILGFISIMWTISTNNHLHDLLLNGLFQCSLNFYIYFSEFCFWYCLLQLSELLLWTVMFFTPACTHMWILLTHVLLFSRIFLNSSISYKVIQMVIALSNVIWTVLRWSHKIKMFFTNIYLNKFLISPVCIMECSYW